MFISILLLFMFILLIYYYYVHYGRNGLLLHLLPGPPSIPIFGHSFLFQVSAVEQWKLLCTLYDKYYPIMKIWGLFEFGVSIRHPDDLEKILSSTKHIEKSRFYNMLHPWFGTGLLTSTASKDANSRNEARITRSKRRSTDFVRDEKLNRREERTAQ